MKRIKRLFAFKKKRKEKKLLEKIGGICMHEFYHSRKMRRKIKGTRLEYLLIKTLENDSTN